MLLRYFPLLSAIAVSGSLLVQAQTAPPPVSDPAIVVSQTDGSTYVPMDSWIYPALDRLHSLGYLDTAFLGIRPWTRLSIENMLERSADRIDSETGNEEAREIFNAVLDEVRPQSADENDLHRATGELESVYTNLRGIGGTPLRDSYHLGQTIVNEDRKSVV